MKLNRIFNAIMALFALCLLSACGGGGKADGGTTPPPPPTTVTVTVPDTGGTGSVGGAVVSFPSDAFTSDTTVNLTTQAPTTDVPNPNVQFPSNEIVVRPQDNQVQSDITVSFPDSGESLEQLVATTHTNDGQIRPSKLERVGGRLVVTVPIQNFALAQNAKTNDGVQDQRPAGTFYDWVIVKLGKLPSSTFATKLFRLASGGTGSKILVICHGWNDRSSSFQLLANQMLNTGLYNEVWAVDYDSRRPIGETGEDVANILESLRLEHGNKMVDLLAHSMGGLVSRVALEYGGATGAVRNLFTVCTPHAGTITGAAADSLLYFLNGDFLNNPFAKEQVVPSSFSLTQMVPGSLLLRELNDNSPGQTGLVNYMLLGAYGDVAVDTFSSTAANVVLEELTEGKVVRHLEGGTHSYFVKNATGIQVLRDYVVSFVNSSGSGGVEIRATPSVMDPYDEYRWRCQYEVVNNSGGTIKLVDNRFDSYDANGDWYGRSWIDDGPDGPLPTEYSPANVSIANGSSWPTDTFISYYAGQVGMRIADAPENLRRKTKVVTVRYTKNGQLYTLRQKLYCRWNGQMPSNANTRAPINEMQGKSARMSKGR